MAALVTYTDKSTEIIPNAIGCHETRIGIKDFKDSEGNILKSIDSDEIESFSIIDEPKIES